MLVFIVLLICTYFYLYNPVFSVLPTADSLMLLYPLCLLYTKSEYRAGIKDIQDILKYWFLLFLYITATTIMGGDQVYLYGWIGYLIETILITYFLSIIIVKNNINIVTILLTASSIAATISCLCLFVPVFDSLIRAIQIEYTEVNSQIVFRAYGLAQGLNFDYGVIQGLIFGIGLFYLKSNRWYILFIPFVIISILINARTGFIVVILALIFYSISNKSYKSLFAGVLIFSLLGLTYKSLKDLIPTDTYLWIEEFFLELGDAVFGTNNAQYNTGETLNEMLIWPQDAMSWIFGTGHSLFRVKSGAHSDVGYINQLAYGGLIYMLLLFFMCWRTLKKDKPYIQKNLFLLVIVTLLLVNFKGTAIGNNGGIFKLVSLLSLVLFYKNKKVYEDTIHYRSLSDRTRIEI